MKEDPFVRPAEVVEVEGLQATHIPPALQPSRYLPRV
jgi:hypothetical protein